MASRLNKGSITLSMIVGTLLVPLTAVAALWLTGSDDDTAQDSTTTSTSPVLPVASTPETTVPDVTAADIDTACGPEGMQLVALEDKGTITDVQQAALDALRELCDQEGLSLPDKPPSDPVVRNVIVPITAATTAAAVASSADESQDEYEYEDDEYEDHDEYEEHEDRSDYEDGREHEESDD